MKTQNQEYVCNMSSAPLTYKNGFVKLYVFNLTQTYVIFRETEVRHSHISQCKISSCKLSLFNSFIKVKYIFYYHAPNLMIPFSYSQCNNVDVFFKCDDLAYFVYLFGVFCFILRNVWQRVFSIAAANEDYTFVIGGKLVLVWPMY